MSIDAHLVTNLVSEMGYDLIPIDRGVLQYEGLAARSIFQSEKFLDGRIDSVALLPDETPILR